MPTPALVDNIPFQCVRAADGNVVNVVITSASPTTKVGAFPLAVTNGATDVVSTSGGPGTVTLKTSIVKDNNNYVVLAGSPITLNSGHVGVVPVPVLAGTSVDLS